MILFKGRFFLGATIAHAEGLDKFGASDGRTVIFFIEKDKIFE
jgi:hypothetical protein